MSTITALQYSTINNMLSLFEEQVSRCPDSIALLYADQQMTYSELDQRANQLAWHLQKLSVKPESLVGVCTSRSLDMIVAILGVLKAGGAYVPLDPSYPQERLSFILEDARAPVVITQGEFSSSFSGQQVQTVCLDVDWSRIESNPIEPPRNDALPENLAYVIYTSGSTGKPKGVMVTHSNLSNFIRISSLALDVTRSDVCLQTASIAYALSVRQIMIPLCKGATLVIATTEEMRDPLLMFELIKRKCVSLMDVVPSFWRTCIQRFAELPDDELNTLMDNSLRRIVSIGEPLSSDLPREWTSRFGSRVMLVNIFGQTETTGVVAVYPIPFQQPPRVEIVPVGRSIPDTRLYLLDPDLQPVLDGEQGELCVSNASIARGYLNHPELTAQKFIPNPFQDDLSPRLYRTGDMARMREDGSIEFIGRGDQQVKIRGQRLELGEVDATLREHPSVQDCVVVTRGDHPDEKYLVAYVISVPGCSSNIPLLKDFVRSRVPDYMVPSVFVFLDAFPLTPNGKLNRLALPDPGVCAGNTESGCQFAEPRTPIEKTIARIWRDLLKLGRVGIHEDYFELGGHSLMSVRMFSRIERELGVRLPYNTLLQARTIAQIAQLVENTNRNDTKWSIAVPIQKEGNKHPFFGVHGREGGVLFWRHIAAHLPKEQPFYGLEAVGVDGLQPPLTRIPAMAELYIQEMRKVQPHGPYYIGGYSMGGEIAFEISQQLVQQGERVDLLVMFDTLNPRRALRRVVMGEDGLLVPENKTTIPAVGLNNAKQKIKGHFIHWLVLDPRAKISYIWRQITLRTYYLAINVSVGIFRILRKRLPDLLLHRYLRKTHSQALANYVPVPYPGKVTLFRAYQTLSTDSDDSPLGWEPLAKGGLEIYYFDTNHLDMMNVEYSQEISSRLNECLVKARALNQNVTYASR